MRKRLKTTCGQGGGGGTCNNAVRAGSNCCAPLLYHCSWCMQMRIPRRLCTEHACLSEVHVGSRVFVCMYVRPCRYF